MPNIGPNVVVPLSNLATGTPPRWIPSPVIPDAGVYNTYTFPPGHPAYLQPGNVRGGYWVPIMAGLQLGYIIWTAAENGFFSGEVVDAAGNPLQPPMTLEEIEAADFDQLIRATIEFLAGHGPFGLPAGRDGTSCERAIPIDERLPLTINVTSVPGFNSAWYEILTLDANIAISRPENVLDAQVYVYTGRCGRLVQMTDNIQQTPVLVGHTGRIYVRVTWRHDRPQPPAQFDIISLPGARCGLAARRSLGEEVTFYSTYGGTWYAIDIPDSLRTGGPYNLRLQVEFASAGTITLSEGVCENNFPHINGVSVSGCYIAECLGDGLLVAGTGAHIFVQVTGGGLGGVTFTVDQGECVSVPPGASCAEALELAAGATSSEYTLLSEEEHWFKVTGISAGTYHVTWTVADAGLSQDFGCSTHQGECGSLVAKEGAPFTSSPICFDDAYDEGDVYIAVSSVGAEGVNATYTLRFDTGPCA
jgi:hypothetical protein